MANVARNLKNSWFQKLNHIRLRKSDETKALVLDSGDQLAIAAGKSIVSSDDAVTYDSDIVTYDGVQVQFTL